MPYNKHGKPCGRPYLSDTLKKQAVMMKQDFYSTKEIAAKLGMSYGSVAVYITEARKHGVLQATRSGIMISDAAYAVLHKKAKSHDLSIERYILEVLND